MGNKKSEEFFKNEIKTFLNRSYSDLPEHFFVNKREECNMFKLSRRLQRIRGLHENELESFYREIPLEIKLELRGEDNVSYLLKDLKKFRKEYIEKNIDIWNFDREDRSQTSFSSRGLIDLIRSVGNTRIASVGSTSNTEIGLEIGMDYKSNGILLPPMMCIGLRTNYFSKKWGWKKIKERGKTIYTC
jgi:hypothetical protein